MIKRANANNNNNKNTQTQNAKEKSNMSKGAWRGMRAAEVAARNLKYHKWHKMRS